MKLESLMTLHVEVAEIVSTGPTPCGEIRVVPFIGGTFEGAGVRGRILPGGTDWQRVRADGVLEISAHYLLETDQGERIEVTSQGIRHARPDVLERMNGGELVPAHEYYFRTFIRLNTAATRLERWNRMLVVSLGERTQRAVRLQLFEVP